MINKDFWSGKKVFITGNTGFKGSWLCLWLISMGAKVTGYALNPPTHPSLYELCKVNEYIQYFVCDIRNQHRLNQAIQGTKPDIVFHMAAQPLVRESYNNPVETYSINTIGTVNLLEAVRQVGDVKAVVNVTTDKCYENKEWVWGYWEKEPMGGYDPYSNSKACSELITSCYRHSFFNTSKYNEHGVGLASSRAGNVIGGGDWASDRLVPDIIRALIKGEKVLIRNPHAIRPWQHVLDCLGGYMVLAEKLYENGPMYSCAWNFGPNQEDAKTVEWIVSRISSKWDTEVSYEIDTREHPHEANFLKLDCSKARMELGYSPRWNIEQAIDRVVEWTIAYKNNSDMKQICMNQIAEYMAAK